MLKSLKTKKNYTYFQIAVAGFSAVILIGALLLMLPISSAEGVSTPFINALFTSTTSVCVTGLVVYDTGTYWSLFGQVIILLLIQIGGLGVITVASSFMIISGKKINLMQRNSMQEAMSAPKMGGIVRLTGFILKATFFIEILGALLMAPVFCTDFGFLKGLWMSFFHSISAFCNAGIDLMGIREPFSSMTSYATNPVINITIMLLIIIGGIGFLTWEDVKTNKLHFVKYRMQSKIILTTTAFLIIVPAIIFFFFEFDNMPMVERFWNSIFQAVTPRTAGFNTADLTQMSSAGQMLTIFLMLIGGSPGSTAGGMKTTTFAVLIACVISVFCRRDDAQSFGRRISQSVISTAATVSFVYINLCLFSAMIISVIEDLPIMICLYETASAIATVGLSLGITSSLGTVSKIILIGLMYFGRVGGLTIIYAALSTRKLTPGKLPQEKIIVG